MCFVWFCCLLIPKTRERIKKTMSHIFWHKSAAKKLARPDDNNNVPLHTHTHRGFFSLPDYSALYIDVNALLRISISQYVRFVYDFYFGKETKTFAIITYGREIPGKIIRLNGLTRISLIYSVCKK